MGTDGELVVPPERHGLQLRVIANPRRCTLAGERRAVDDDIGAVEYDLVRGPMHADINRHRGLERERAGVRGELDTIVLRSHRRGQRFALASQHRPRSHGGEQQQRQGISTHGVAKKH